MPPRSPLAQWRSTSSLMRPKYDTSAIVLSRTPFGEVSAIVTLLTLDLGLLRALAQSIRQEGAKLAPALTTFTESTVRLVRGKEGWRVTGAVLEERWAEKLPSLPARIAAARLSGLVTRLVGSEVRDTELFGVMRAFLYALSRCGEDDYETTEQLAALRILSVLGLDAGAIPGALNDFSPETLDAFRRHRGDYLVRINQGITASGL